MDDIGLRNHGRPNRFMLIADPKLEHRSVQLYVAVGGTPARTGEMG